VDLEMGWDDDAQVLGTAKNVLASIGEPFTYSKRGRRDSAFEIAGFVRDSGLSRRAGASPGRRR